MPSVAEEMRTARTTGYLVGLHAAMLRLQDDEGLPRSSQQVLRELKLEVARVQGGGKMPGL